MEKPFALDGCPALPSEVGQRSVLLVVGAALILVPCLPVCGQRLVQILKNTLAHHLVFTDLGVRGLCLLRESGKFAVHPQRLTASVPDHGLRPELVNLRAELVLHPLAMPYAAHLDRPESPVAGAVSQEVQVVCRSVEHASPERHGLAPRVSAAEPVVLLRDVVLHVLHLGLAHAGQLRDLRDPHAADRVLRVLPVAELVNGVGEPSLRELPPELRFSYALRAGQHEHVVKLAPRHESSCHRAAHPLPCSGAHERRILGAHPPDKHRVQPILSVPYESVQVVLQRVEGAVVRNDLHGVVQLAWEVDAPPRLYIHAEPGVVHVRPHVPVSPAAHCLPVPCARSEPDKFSAQPVEGEHAAHLRVVSQDTQEIPRRRLDASALVQRELPLPAGVVPGLRVGHVRLVRPVCIARVPVRLSAVQHTLQTAASLLRRAQLHCVLLCGELQHLPVRGQLGHVGALSRARHLLPSAVQLAELVDAHKVEGVHEPSTAGVCAVVGVEEPPAVVEHGTAHRRTGAIGVPAFPGGLVYIREERVNGGGDVVGAAEETDHAGLLLRVALSPALRHDDLLLPFTEGPECGVPPRLAQPVLAEHGVGVCRLTLQHTEERNPVHRARGPVHQTRHIVGAAVHDLQPDAGGQLTRNGRVLLRCNGAI